MRRKVTTKVEIGSKCSLFHPWSVQQNNKFPSCQHNIMYSNTLAIWMWTHTITYISKCKMNGLVNNPSSHEFLWKCNIHSDSIITHIKMWIWNWLSNISSAKCVLLQPKQIKHDFLSLCPCRATIYYIYYVRVHLHLSPFEWCNHPYRLPNCEFNSSNPSIVHNEW